MRTVLTLYLILVASLTAPAAVTLQWDPSPGASGYALHYGLESRQYTHELDTGVATSAAIADLTPGATYFFGAVAWNAMGTSGYSNEATYTVPEANQPPTVAITFPTPGSTVARKTHVTIGVTATDADGIDRVRVTVNGASLCTDAATPYQCVWSVPAANKRVYRLQAQGWDTQGLRADSAIVQVQSQ